MRHFLSLEFLYVFNKKLHRVCYWWHFGQFVSLYCCMVDLWSWESFFICFFLCLVWKSSCYYFYIWWYIFFIILCFFKRRIYTIESSFLYQRFLSMRSSYSICCSIVSFSHHYYFHMAHYQYFLFHKVLLTPVVLHYHFLLQTKICFQSIFVNFYIFPSTRHICKVTSVSYKWTLQVLQLIYENYFKKIKYGSYRDMFNNYPYLLQLFNYLLP